MSEKNRIKKMSKEEAKDLKDMVKNGNFSVNLIRQTSFADDDTYYTWEFIGSGRVAEKVVIPDLSTAQYKDLARVV